MAEHKFVVHRKSGDRNRTVRGSSFEDAALIYLEEFHPPADATGDVMLIVRHDETGREQCFRIEVASGRTAPCS